MQLSDATLWGILQKLWNHLSRRRRRQFWMLTVLMFVSAFAEVVSLGAVLPFIGILVSPEKVFSHPLVHGVTQNWGIISPDQLVLPLTIMFAAAALLAGGIRVVLLWSITRYVADCGADLSLDIYRRTLYQPYRVHVSRNSSSVISGSIKVNSVVIALSQLLVLISSIVLLVALTIAMILVDSMVAFIAAFGFGICYALIAFFSRRQLGSNAKLIAHEHTQMIKAQQEGLGGIRDVLLDGTQPIYSEIYSQADAPLRRAQGSNAFIGQYPRYAMESFGMVLIAALTYGLSFQIGGISAALPVLGALALGAQRLLPALQLSYNAWVNIAGSRDSIIDVTEMLDQPVAKELLLPTPEQLAFSKAITLDSVSYRYNDDGPWVLDGLNVTIPKGMQVGFVGKTGSGKSSTLDLLMGLLTPNKGSVLVDGQTLGDENMRAWQQTVAHVPQSIFLSDATVTKNIAFGVSPEDIDMERVKRAARRAQISDFIEGMADGYETAVGERGISLSGGQRQRIGIARALYKRARVLVLDEATSALDVVTERLVMNAIEELEEELTILIIAHRIETIRNCDMIVEMSNGKIVSQGTYQELSERNPDLIRLILEDDTSDDTSTINMARRSSAIQS